MHQSILQVENLTELLFAVNSFEAAHLEQLQHALLVLLVCFLWVCLRC